MLQRIGTALAIILLITAGGAGYVAIRANLESEIYRDRLRELVEEYDRLEARHQEAIRKSAVTELLVDQDGLSILIRTAEGVLKQVSTPFNPDHEIYLDYLRLEDRLWIRRVFDNETPPSQAVVVDPAFADIDWLTRDEHEYGQAVYRRLSEGRWIVTATGSGALGLTRISDSAQFEIVSPPPVRDFSEIEEAARKETDRIGPIEVVRRVLFP